MLNCDQGFSVDRCSKDINGCYPVCDKDGRVLKGVEATEYLLNTLHIFPTVCLRKPDKNKYENQLAIVEKVLLWEERTL